MACLFLYFAWCILFGSAAGAKIRQSGITPSLLREPDSTSATKAAVARQTRSSFRFRTIQNLFGEKTSTNIRCTTSAAGSCLLCGEEKIRDGCRKRRDDIEEGGQLGPNPSFTLDCLQRGPSVHRVPSARPLVRLHIGAIVHNCPQFPTQLLTCWSILYISVRCSLAPCPPTRL